MIHLHVRSAAQVLGEGMRVLGTSLAGRTDVPVIERRLYTRPPSEAAVHAAITTIHGPWTPRDEPGEDEVRAWTAGLAAALDVMRHEQHIEDGTAVDATCPVCVNAPADYPTDRDLNPEDET